MNGSKNKSKEKLENTLRHMKRKTLHTKTTGSSKNSIKNEVYSNKAYIKKGRSQTTQLYISKK